MEFLQIVNLLLDQACEEESGEIGEQGEQPRAGAPPGSAAKCPGAQTPFLSSGSSSYECKLPTKQMWRRPAPQVPWHLRIAETQKIQ
jgi:hypothetical protein